MKTNFIPDYTKGNPYQKLLADSLLHYGVKVQFEHPFKVFTLLRIARKNWKPDVIHLHWIHFLIPQGKNFVKISLKLAAYLLDIVLVRIMQIKVVWTVHNMLSHECKNVKLELFVRRMMAKYCDKMIIHCRRVLPELQSLYKANKDKFVVIPIGNYIHYRNSVDKIAARNQLQMDIKGLIFLYFGKIRGYKGVLKLIDAFKKLNFSNIKLLIVGKPQNDEIAENIKQKCVKNKNIRHILKRIPDNEIQVYMNAADIIVMPFRNILTSSSIILAMSFGKPIIAPAIGCIPDYLDNKGGFIYNPLEEDGLDKAMQNVLNVNTKKLKEMGKHNFGLAKKLRWNDIAKQTYTVYKEYCRK